MTQKTLRLRLAAGLGTLALGLTGAAALRPSPAPVPVSAAVAEVSAPLYTVREYMGVVAVFSPENGLVRLTDCAVASLPEQDRLRLTEGVTVDSEEALAMLLEDYQG